MKLKTLKVSDLIPSESIPVSRFKGPQFDELVASVKEKGILTPILVRPVLGDPKGRGFQIVAGHRRHAAAVAAGLKEIPAQVRGMTDAEMHYAQNL